MKLKQALVVEMVKKMVMVVQVLVNRKQKVAWQVAKGMVKLLVKRKQKVAWQVAKVMVKLLAKRKQKVAWQVVVKRRSAFLQIKKVAWQVELVVVRRRSGFLQIKKFLLRMMTLLCPGKFLFFFPISYKIYMYSVNIIPF